jgi:CRISPR-associated protein Cas6
MFWQEDAPKKDRPQASERLFDLAFAIRCRSLPVDHAFALESALGKALPWLGEEPYAGVHVIHVAATGHGWQRPEHGGDQLLHPSRRTKMTLRLPKECLSRARRLTGQTLEIDGHRVEVGQSTALALRPHSTLFARYVVAEDGGDEGRFLEHAVQILGNMGIRARKLLCGKAHLLTTPQRQIPTRSLMIAELSDPDSLQLQELGLGPRRRMGCGLFIAHKGIEAVRAAGES